MLTRTTNLLPQYPYVARHVTAKGVCMTEPIHPLAGVSFSSVPRLPEYGHTSYDDGGKERADKHSHTRLPPSQSRLDESSNCRPSALLSAPSSLHLTWRRTGWKRSHTQYAKNVHPVQVRCSGGVGSMSCQGQHLASHGRNGEDLPLLDQTSSGAMELSSFGNNHAPGLNMSANLGMASD